MWDQFKTFMGGLLFQVLIGFAAATILVGYGMFYYQKYRTEEAIKLGCFIHNKVVYEIKERQ